MIDNMKDALLAEGFKAFKQRCLGHDNAEANYQKCYRAEDGKRYFITVFQYDHSRLPGWPPHINPTSFQFEAQFKQGHDDGQVVNITTNGKEPAELPSILEMFERIWRGLGGVYYEQDEP